MLRIGYGEDSHLLAAGVPLVVGGVTVPAPRGGSAHSDGDVLLHALADALLAAFALGDIGQLFPPGDPATKGIASSIIVAEALRQVEARGDWRVVNAAAVVTLDAPKLGPYRGPVQDSVSTLLRLPPASAGVTFKTSEGLAPDHIQARATVLLTRGATGGL